MKNLIERYTLEVGKHLPRKIRADIQTEISSTLQDMLEEQSRSSGRPVDDEMVKDLLIKYGAPSKVAESYLPERYLIGPKMFPIFTLVLKIVAAVLTVLAIVGFGLRFGTSDMSLSAFGAQLAKSALEYFGGILSAFGNIVLIFAILERTLPKSEYENELKDHAWDPAELLEEPEPDEIRPWESILGIVFTLISLSIFNFYPQVLGFNPFAGTGTVFLPALTDAFFRMLPWINITCLLTIIMHIFLLRSGRWTPTLRWFEIVLKIAGVWIAFMLLRGPSIIDFDTAAMLKASIEPAAAATLVGLFKQMTTIGLAIAVIAGSIEAARGIYNLLFKHTPVTPLVIK